MSITMRNVQALMKATGTIFLATTDGQRAQVRPMSAYIWVNDELWMASGVKSGKVADVRKCASVEVCAMRRDFVNVRIAGRMRVSRVAADKERMFGAFPWMKHYFESADSREWVVLRIKPTSMRYMGSDMKTVTIPV